MQKIMVFLNGDESLDSVLAHFQHPDETIVQAALFQLLADGWVISPDLAVELLDSATRFHRLPVVVGPANS